jgi:general secretion pathway protein C
MFLQDKLNMVNAHTEKIYYVIFNIIAITIIVYTGVDIFNRIISMNFAQVAVNVTQPIQEQEQPVAVRSSLNNYRPIADRNIFSKVNVSPAKTEEENAIIITSLKLTLLGTIAGDNKTSTAFIEDAATKTQGLYKVGDNIQGAVIKSISRNRVVIKMGNRDEILEMGEDTLSGGLTGMAMTSNQGMVEAATSQLLPAALTGAERDISMNRKEVNESLKDLNGLLSQASIQPHSTDGQPDGLAVSGIKAGSIFRKMGLRNGDIVKSVNNEAIKTPEDLINMYNELKTAPDISVQILRRGQERTLNYNFVD